MSTPTRWDPKIETSISAVQPDWYEMCQRHLSTARFWKRLADASPGSVKEQNALKNAASSFRLAQHARDEHARRLEMSR